MKKHNNHGGGAQTNKNGLLFERETSLSDAIDRIPGMGVIENRVFSNGKEIGMLCGKHDLYKHLLKPYGVNDREITSKRLLPDEAFYNYTNETVYIFEKKFQINAGSVDEKLQTCSFKKKQYEKLFNRLGIEVEYIYILNDWFDTKQYRDVYEYILSVGCHYFFNEIPMNMIGID